MACNRGLTRTGVIILGVVAVVVCVILYPVFVRGPDHHPYKAVCLSNIKQITLACIMYAQDYGETLPTCVADDQDGTAHAVGGVFADRTIEQVKRDAAERYGEEYADARWMWQLADLVAPYIKSEDIFNCLKAVKVDADYRIRSYAIGTDKLTGEKDPRDPLLRLVRKNPELPYRKVWQSGSYTYMCMHHPHKSGRRAAAYGSDFMSLWDVAAALGYLDPSGASADPQDYFACGNAYSGFSSPVYKPLVMCRSWGVHEDYSEDYARAHAIPPELAPDFGLTERQVTPTIPVAKPMGFADGHAKYWRSGFYDWMALLFTPNRF
jgi:hypothetical protein